MRLSTIAGKATWLAPDYRAAKLKRAGPLKKAVPGILLTVTRARSARLRLMCAPLPAL